jgi:signal transduction histidine kinase
MNAMSSADPADRPLSILHLEDDPLDAERVRGALIRGGLGCDVSVAATRAQYLEALGSGSFDLILSDGSIPGFDGFSALEAARERSPGTPFIFVSGHPVDQPRDVSSPVECVLKTQLEQLAPVIERVLRGAASGAPRAEDSSHRTEHLINVVQELSLARDLATVMAIVRRAARQLTGADGATFILRERELCYYADEDAIAPLWKGKRFPMAACISGWAMLNRQSAVIEDIYADPRIPADAYRPTFVRSLAMVPIRTANPVGAIGTYWATRHEATPEEVKLLQTLANSTSIAMENVQLLGELEQRVRERTAQLEAANRELEAFSYSVSHDLRAPLRHIDGFSELLVEESADRLDEAGRGHLQRIRRAAGRMNELIEDLLSLSRITRTEVQKETIDLTRLAREIAADLQGSGRPVEFAAEEGVSAEGDPGLLRVVLENLLSNAWKYTAVTAQPRVAFGCRHESGGQRIYYVRDNGAGFDMAFAGRLFGVFQRLHSDSEFPGTGVGLATVERIVRKHGGRIWAEAAVGEGATFSFTLA